MWAGQGAACHVQAWLAQGPTCGCPRVEGMASGVGRVILCGASSPGALAREALSAGLRGGMERGREPGLQFWGHQSAHAAETECQTAGLQQQMRLGVPGRWKSETQVTAGSVPGWVGWALILPADTHLLAKS